MSSFGPCNFCSLYNPSSKYSCLDICVLMMCDSKQYKSLIISPRSFNDNLMFVLFLSACNYKGTNLYISFCNLGGAKVTWNYSIGSEGCLRNYTRGNAVVCSKFNIG